VMPATVAMTADDDDDILYVMVGSKFCRCSTLLHVRR